MFLGDPNLIKSYLDNPQVLDQMMLPYSNGMEAGLKVIKEHHFDARTHRGLDLVVKDVAKKEKARLFQSL